MNTEQLLEPYRNLWVLIPVAAMFVILFAIIRRTLSQVELFEGGATNVVAFCVSALALYGMDQAIIRTIVAQYAAMGSAMLIALAGMLLTVWIATLRHARDHVTDFDRDRRPHDKDN